MMIDLNIRKYGKYVLAAVCLGVVLGGFSYARSLWAAAQDAPVIRLEKEDIAVPEDADTGEMPWLLQPTVATGILEELISSDKLLAEYRMERQRLRGEETASLQEIMANTAESSEVRAMAAQRLIDRMEQEEKELRIEYLLKSSGVGDCVVMLEGEEVHILLPCMLPDENAAKAKENAAQLAGVPAEQVHLIMREETGAAAKTPPPTEEEAQSSTRKKS